MEFPVLDAPLAADAFVEAAQLYRTARRRGLTVRSSVDCLIAATALRSGASVLHRDRDFGVLAKVCALKALALT